MYITPQQNCNYANNINSLNSKNNTNYATVQFRGGQQLIGDTVQTTIKKSCTSERIAKFLLALGLGGLAEKITVQPFKKDIKSMQANIDSKRNDMKKRDEMGTYFYDKTKSAGEMKAYRQQLDDLLELEQKYLDNFKTDITPNKDKKSLTKDDISNKVTELQTDMSKLDTEYTKVNDELKKLENARYEELVDKEVTVRKWIDEYNSLVKEYDKLEKEEFNNSELNDRLNMVNARINSVKSELSSLNSKYEPIEAKIKSLEKENADLIKRLNLQDTSNSVIAEEKGKLCKKNQDAINEILQDEKTKTLRKTIDAKNKELEQAEQERDNISHELTECHLKHSKEVKAKLDDIMTKRLSLRNKIEKKIGFYMTYHPYYYSGRDSRTVNIPEWITTTKGEKPFKTIKDTYESWTRKVPHIIDYPYEIHTTRTEYYEAGGKFLD